eukprot:2688523-Lingulodinium_polyedra.AAC.1
MRGGRKPCSAPCRSTHSAARMASSASSRPPRLWLNCTHPPCNASGLRLRMAVATRAIGNERQGCSPTSAPSAW